MWISVFIQTQPSQNDIARLQYRIEKQRELASRFKNQSYLLMLSFFIPVSKRYSFVLSIWCWWKTAAWNKRYVFEFFYQALILIATNLSNYNLFCDEIRIIQKNLHKAAIAGPFRGLSGRHGGRHWSLNWGYEHHLRGNETTITNLTSVYERGILYLGVWGGRRHSPCCSIHHVSAMQT